MLILDKFTLLSLSSSSFRYSLDIQHLSTDFFFASISLSTSPWSFVFLIDCFCCHVKVVNYISTFYVIIFLTTISALVSSLVFRLISCTTCSSQKGVTAHSFQMMMPELKISDGSTLGCFVEDLYLLTHHHYKILCLKKVPRLSNQYQTFKMSYTYYKKSRLLGRYT